MGKFVYVMHANSWMVFMYLKPYIYWLHAFIAFLFRNLRAAYTFLRRTLSCIRLSCMHLFTFETWSVQPFFWWHLDLSVLQCLRSEAWAVKLASFLNWSCANIVPSGGVWVVYITYSEETLELYRPFTSEIWAECIFFGHLEEFELYTPFSF